MSTKLRIKKQLADRETSFKLAKSFYWLGEAGPLTLRIQHSIGEALQRELIRIIHTLQGKWETVPRTTRYDWVYRGEAYKLQLDSEYDITQLGMRLQLSTVLKDGRIIAVRRFLEEYKWQQN